jgi:hypothetical protein
MLWGLLSAFSLSHSPSPLCYTLLLDLFFSTTLVAIVLRVLLVLCCFQSYSDWINGDLYEQTDEHFGICAFPGVSYFNWPVCSLNIWFVNDTIEALQTCLARATYSLIFVKKYWQALRSSWWKHKKCQGLSMPQPIITGWNLKGCSNMLIVWLHNKCWW